MGSPWMDRLSYKNTLLHFLVSQKQAGHPSPRCLSTQPKALIDDLSQGLGYRTTSFLKEVCGRNHRFVVRR